MLLNNQSAPCVQVPADAVCEYAGDLLQPQHQAEEQEHRRHRQCQEQYGGGGCRWRCQCQCQYLDFYVALLLFSFGPDLLRIFGFLYFVAR